MLLHWGLDFSTKNAYEAILRELDENINAKIIWETRIPNKIKVFAWLAFRDRLNTMANLAHKQLLRLALDATLLPSVPHTSSSHVLTLLGYGSVWGSCQLPHSPTIFGECYYQLKHLTTFGPLFYSISCGESRMQGMPKHSKILTPSLLSSSS